jgi:hypothetical protein
MRWRFAVAGLLCIGAGPDPGAMLPFELGVLSCTLGHAIDPQMSDQTAPCRLCPYVKPEVLQGTYGLPVTDGSGKNRASVQIAYPATDRRKLERRDTLGL